MTNEEAIRRLRDHFAIHDDGRPTPYLDEAERIAIEALEKQIPKKVVYKMGCHGGALCPNCRTVFEYRMDNWKSPFCQHCGQAISWEGEE